jgi:hypothetical protein
VDKSSLQKYNRRKDGVIMKRYKYVIFAIIFICSFFIIRGIVIKNMDSTKKLLQTGKSNEFFNATILNETEDYFVVKAYGKQDYFKKSMEIEVSKDIMTKDGISTSLVQGEKVRIVFNKASIVLKDNKYKINIVYVVYRLSEIE